MPLIVISCAWVLGLFLGARYSLSWPLIFSGLIPLPLIFLYRAYRKTLVVTAIGIAVLFGAAFYYPFTIPNDSTLAVLYNGQEVEIKGEVVAPPENRDNITHIELAAQEVNGQRVRGKVLVFVPRYPAYSYGDVLRLKGKLEDPPQFDDFDYQAYLAREGIYSTLLSPKIEIVERGRGAGPLAWIYAFRESLSQNLAAALPEPQAALAQGIVLGVRNTIPSELKTNLSVTGTAHLLAISGINLSIIAGLLVTLGLWLFGRRHYIYVWLALSIIWFYALITGMQAPVIRSAIMASLFLLAELLGRQKNAFAALAFGAAIMVGITPRILWSVSFQLSFLSMAGLIFIAPTLQNLGRKAVYAALDEEGLAGRTATAVTDSFSITLGAIIAVWPVIAFNFGIISLVGPLSTFLIAPALSLIIIFGAVTALIGLASLPAAQVTGWIAWLFLSYMLWLVNAFASLPMAAMNTGAVSETVLRIYYSILGLAIILKVNFKKFKGLFSKLSGYLETGWAATSAKISPAPKKFIIIPLMAAACLTTLASATLPEQDLHVSFLDVGEGDASLVQIGNQNILIDGGPGSQAVCLGLSDKLPFWNRTLDLVVLTHPHLDHLSGLVEVLKRYKVGQILAPRLASPTPAYQEWMDMIRSQNIPLTPALAGQQLKLRNGAILDILNPVEGFSSDSEETLENNGLAARLSLNKISFLFTADIESETESDLISRRADLACTVLKVAHHGSSGSTTADFLAVARPQIAVISVGADNTFGHPGPQVLERLSGRTVYRTDKDGTIEFTTDGERLWVKTTYIKDDTD